MNKKLVFLGIVGALVMLFAVVLAASAVSGAAYTTFNPWVDGDFKVVCKNSQINCNIYGSKPDVWLNGGPAANGLGPDGQYFFAVVWLMIVTGCDVFPSASVKKRPRRSGIFIVRKKPGVTVS